MRANALRRLPANGTREYHARVGPDAYDLVTLFAHREVLAGLDPSGEARLAPLQPVGRCSSVAVLPGSFNPPTAAHVLLAERALGEGFDCVLLLFARATAGKDPTGLIPEDRLLALRLAASRPGLVVAACSASLYCDQAEAVARAYPGADVAFLVGSDKVEEIFDPRWYADRDASLEALFSSARLLVSPRADNGDRMRAMIERPENRRFTSKVSVLPLHPAVSDLSSTRVRGLLQAGAGPSGLVPQAVGEFLAETRAFAPPLLIGSEEVDAYGVRARLVDACWQGRDWAERSVDLRALVDVALGATDEGARLRAALSRPDVRPEELARL
jgi:nicotinic acid mononucleotide adenylyltransferase